MPDSFDGFGNLWPGADSGDRMRGMHLPPGIFKNVFEVLDGRLLHLLIEEIKCTLAKLVRR